MQDRPSTAQNRLLVPHRDIAPDQEGQQLAVREHFFPVDRNPSRLRLDHELRIIGVLLGQGSRGVIRPASQEVPLRRRNQ